MSFPRDTVSEETIEAVAALAQVGRGTLEKRARDLARLLDERDARIKALETLLDQIEELATDPELYAYDVAAGLRSILRER